MVKPDEIGSFRRGLPLGQTPVSLAKEHIKILRDQEPRNIIYRILELLALEIDKK